MASATALGEALKAPRHDFDSSSAGRMAYYADSSASGRPLVLLHSINAAPSAMEIKPLFERYRGSRPVYAPDLPGYGHSDRHNLEYNGQLYADTLNEWCADCFDQPVDVVALSLTSEFAARAARQQPSQINSITMVSPTGLGKRQPPGETASRRLYKAFHTPLFGAGLYRALTSRPSISYFLGKGFYGDTPQEMLDYACHTTRQPGARYAPFCFLSFKMFDRDSINSLYQPLDTPSLVLYDEDPNVSFEKLPGLLQNNSHWQAARIQPTLGLPHWEQLEKTVTALDSFWRGISAH